MNKKEELELIIAALKSLRTRTKGVFGICMYFQNYKVTVSGSDILTPYFGSWRKFTVLDSDILTPYFESWDKFSGDVQYPVPSPINDIDYSTATLALLAYEAGDDMWNKDKQYGRDRHELLEHCITEATKELDTYQEDK